MSFTFYTHPMSRGRIVRWMLEETGLPYDTVLLEYGTTMKAPEYRAINPMGKVPAIRHGDTVITEVAAICLYLADLAPEKKLAPPVGTPERGSYYRWISFMAPLEQLITAKMTGALPKPENAGFGTEQDVLDTLEAALKGRTHLAGDTFTAADLLVSAFVGWYLQFQLLEPRPAFVQFVERHSQRPRPPARRRHRQRLAGQALTATQAPCRRHLKSAICKPQTLQAAAPCWACSVWFDTGAA